MVQRQASSGKIKSLKGPQGGYLLNQDAESITISQIIEALEGTAEPPLPQKTLCPGQVWHLHLAVDDATGRITGAWFDTQETLNGYYHVFNQILTNYGIPYKFFTDKRTVFTYKKKNSPSLDEDTYTQFAYACKQLGVELESSSVPQAKAMVYIDENQLLVGRCGKQSRYGILYPELDGNIFKEAVEKLPERNTSNNRK